MASKYSFKFEPVAWSSAIRQGLLVLVLFGLPLTEIQIAGIMLFAEYVFAAITRMKVSPNARFKQRRRYVLEDANEGTLQSDIGGE